MGVFFGIPLALALGLGLESLDTTLKTPEEVEGLLDIPNLAMMPHLEVAAGHPGKGPGAGGTPRQPPQSFGGLPGRYHQHPLFRSRSAPTHLVNNQFPAPPNVSDRCRRPGDHGGGRAPVVKDI